MRISEERERARDRLAAMDGNYRQRQAVDDFEDSGSFERSPEWLQDFDEDEYEAQPDSSRFDRLPETQHDAIFVGPIDDDRPHIELRCPECAHEQRAEHDQEEERSHRFPPTGDD